VAGAHRKGRTTREITRKARGRRLPSQKLAIAEICRAVIVFGLSVVALRHGQPGVGQ
jgi:hypothetical protein